MKPLKLDKLFVEVQGGITGDTHTVIQKQDAHIAALEAENKKLREALESVDALIEEDMGEWYGVQYAYLPEDYENRALVRDTIRAVLEAKS